MWKIDDRLRQPYVTKEDFDPQVDWHVSLIHRPEDGSMPSCMLIQFSANAGIDRQKAEQIVENMLKGLNT